MIFILAFVPLIQNTHYFTYINKPAFGAWGDPLAMSLGVPGYLSHSYSHVALSFWTCSVGPTDIALTWTNMEIASLGKSPT